MNNAKGTVFKFPEANCVGMRVIFQQSYGYGQFPRSSYQHYFT